MTSGRKPMPTSMKVLRGETRPSRLNRDEPRPAPRRPSCPSYMSASAKRAWRVICRELGAMGGLHAADAALVEVLANALAGYRGATTLVNQTGQLVKGRDGNIVRHPLLIVIKQHSDTIIRVSSELGLSPSARTRLVAAVSAEAEAIEETYFSGRRRESGDLIPIDEYRAIRSQGGLV